MAISAVLDRVFRLFLLAMTTKRQKTTHLQCIFDLIPRPMLSLLLRNLFFTLLQPGVVAGLVPWWLLRDEWPVLSQSPFGWMQYAGFALFIPGLIILLDCILRFAREGRGTLSPVDPTRQLVITGLYQYSRNPMYLGVCLLLAGEAVFAQSLRLGIYAALIFVIFHTFITVIEEPRLKKDFGAAYEAYRKKVKRWL